MYSYENAKKKFKEYTDLISKDKDKDSLKFKKLTVPQAESLAKILRLVCGVQKDASHVNAGTYKSNSILANLAQSRDATIKINAPTLKINQTINIRGEEIQGLQQQAELYFKGEKVDANSSSGIRTIARHIYLLKYAERVPKQEIPKKYTGHGGFTRYKDHLEQQGYHLVCRFPSRTYLSTNHELLSKPINTVRYDAYFPKLSPSKKGGYQSHGYQKFVSGSKIKDIGELKKIYKDIFRSHLKVAAKNNECYSTVVPGAFFAGLSDHEQQRGQKCYVGALVEVIQEVTNDIKKHGHFSEYAGFKGVLVCCPEQEPAKIIRNAHKKGLLIWNNPLHTGALDELSSQSAITAQPTMSEPFSAIGNGAFHNRALKAKDERDMRYSLGVNAAVACPRYNPKLGRFLRFPSHLAKANYSNRNTNTGQGLGVNGRAATPYNHSLLGENIVAFRPHYPEAMPVDYNATMLRQGIERLMPGFLKP